MGHLITTHWMNGWCQNLKYVNLWHWNAIHAQNDYKPFLVQGTEATCTNYCSNSIRDPFNKLFFPRKYCHRIFYPEQFLYADCYFSFLSFLEYFLSFFFFCWVRALNFPNWRRRSVAVHDTEMLSLFMGHYLECKMPNTESSLVIVTKSVVRL